MSQILPEISCPQAWTSLPQVEHALAEYWQVLSALRSAVVHWLKKNPKPRPGSPASSAAMVSDMPSPYCPCPLPPDCTMWWPNSWWLTLANDVFPYCVVPWQKLIDTRSYHALPGHKPPSRLTLTGKFTCVEITG